MKKPDPSGDLAVSLKMLDGITKITACLEKSKFILRKSINTAGV